MMRTSEKGALDIMNREACVLRPYRDAVGIWTIAFGHTRAAGQPDPKVVGYMKLEECMKLFRHDLEKYEAAVNRAFGERQVPQHQFDAAVSFHYNTGAIGRASWVKLYNSGAPMSQIKERFLAWNKPAAIKNRRLAEWIQFETGQTPVVKFLTVYDHFPGKPRRVPIPAPTADDPSRIARFLSSTTFEKSFTQDTENSVGPFTNSGWTGILLRHAMSVAAGVLASSGIIEASQQGTTGEVLTQLVGAALAGASSLVLSKFNKKDARAPLQ
jgi:lysozyme